MSTQKSFLQGPQQFQMLTPQQQQLLLQAQAQGSMSSSGSPLLSDLDARRFRVLLGGRSGLTGKDGQSNGSGDVSQVVGSPMQSASPAPHGTQELAQTELMMKVILDHIEVSRSLGLVAADQCSASFVLVWC